MIQVTKGLGDFTVHHLDQGDVYTTGSDPSRYYVYIGDTPWELGSEPDTLAKPIPTYNRNQVYSRSRLEPWHLKQVEWQVIDVLPLQSFGDVDVGDTFVFTLESLWLKTSTTTAFNLEARYERSIAFQVRVSRAVLQLLIY